MHDRTSNEVIRVCNCVSIAFTTTENPPVQTGLEDLMLARILTEAAYSGHPMLYFISEEEPLDR